MDDLENPLNRTFRLEGVQLGELGRRGELLVDLGTVLHGAGALTDIHVQIRTQVLLRQSQVMLQHLHLAQLGQSRRIVPDHVGGRVDKPSPTSASNFGIGLSASERPASPGWLSSKMMGSSHFAWWNFLSFVFRSIPMVRLP